MSKIRKLYYFDKKNTKDMISVLNNGEQDFGLSNTLFNPFLLLHYLLPLKIKFLPESFVFKDKKSIKGLITVVPSKYPLKQMEIEKLLFEENNYEIAGELIQYAVSKYKAMGTASVIVRVDDCLPELIKLFISRCGFSQISYEKIWKINRIKKHHYDKKSFRLFRNSDSGAVSNLYNDSLLPHFRPLLGKDLKEFKETFFKGLSYCSEYKYVMEDRQTKNIIALVTIKTSDNKNYFIDIVQSSWVEININEILSFARDQIRKRKKRANIFIKTKRYLQNSDKTEQEFVNNRFVCIKNQVVLTNSSAKIIKTGENSKRFTVLSGLYTGMGVIN